MPSSCESSKFLKSLFSQTLTAVLLRDGPAKRMPSGFAPYAPIKEGARRAGFGAKIPRFRAAVPSLAKLLLHQFFIFSSSLATLAIL